MTSRLVLSHFQIAPLLKARNEGHPTATTSPDLNLSQVEAPIEAEGARFPDGALLTWADAERIRGAAQSCFALTDGALEKIQTFSEYTNRHYSLMPTPAAPTLLISGIPMHRIKGTDPHRDTLSKVKTIRPIVGHVLDTATGLGYTAIEAAKSAERVITVELDPAVLEIARQNPWSQALFDNPRITQRIGDSFDVVTEFEDESFSRIVHDPPTFSLAGDLYSGEFYEELYRVLRRNGRLFHYIGDLESKSGHRVTRGVVQRLQQAGFTRVQHRPEAFGVVAFK
jgi:predicted methyltransferase